MTPRLEDRATTSTSAGGTMRPWPSRSAVIIFTLFTPLGTASRPGVTDQTELLADAATTCGYVSCLTPVSEQRNGTQAAIAELRRLSGLTWERLAKVFGVSRRTLHFWASGKAMNTTNEERLFRMLAVIRRMDRGNARENRTLLLTERSGVAPIDLLSMGRWDELLDLVGAGRGRTAIERSPLAAKAAKARKPLPPEELVDALQDPVHRDIGHGRAAKTVRNTRPNRDG